MQLRPRPMPGKWNLLPGDVQMEGKDVLYREPFNSSCQQICYSCTCFRLLLSKPGSHIKYELCKQEPQRNSNVLMKTCFIMQTFKIEPKDLLWIASYFLFSFKCPKKHNITALYVNAQSHVPDPFTPSRKNIAMVTHNTELIADIVPDPLTVSGEKTQQWLLTT